MHAASVVHPTDQTLQSYGLGRLDAAAAGSVHAHLEGCPECRRRAAEMSSDSGPARLRDARIRPESLRPAVSSTDPLSMLDAGAAAPAPPPASTLPPGLADHPDYEVLSELGRGGMGVVYLADNRLMGRKEVLKVVGGHLVSKPAVLERFLREIRSAARLHHPNIVTAYAAMRLGESLVLTMEYVEGLDLARLVKAKGPLPVANACHYVHQAATGLQHAHEHGMVHRDIKPANLILARASGRANKAIVKVLDFGLAKVTSEGQADGGLTREGQMLGTPDYIAPEQIRDAQSADIRADIYSLGCTLYYLLSGGPPFHGDHLWDLYQAHFSIDAEPLNLVRPDVPVELAALVAKMMAKEPGRRFPQPKDVAQALAPFFKKGDVVAGASRVEVSRHGQGVPIDTPTSRPAPSPAKTPIPSPPVITPTEAARAVPERDRPIAVDRAERSPKPAIGDTAPPRRRPPWLWPAIVAASVLGASMLGVLIYVATDYGRITIIEKDADAVARIDGAEIVLKTPPESIALRAGRHEMAVKWDDGRSMTREFVIRRGEQKDLRIQLEPRAGDRASAEPPAPPSPAVSRPPIPPAPVTVTVPRADLTQRPAPPAGGDAPPRSDPESIVPPDVIVEPEVKATGSLGLAEQGFTPLFNGRDLTGWTAFSNSKRVDPYAHARVSGGELILVPSKESGGLRTDRSYRNFTMRLEYLFPVGGILTGPGSGVIVLPESGAGLSYQQGVEWQIRTGETGDVWAFNGATLVGQKRHGQLGKVPRKLDAEKAPGEWNAVVIRCDGSRTTFELNGREVNRAESHRPISGWIALMNQGSAIHFRNIEIHERSPNPRGPAVPAANASRASSVVGKWRHAAGVPNANRGAVIHLATDGSILNDRGAKSGTWSLSGATLVLRWPNKQAPGGAWIDTVVLSPNRKRYNGKNQGGVVVHGAKVEE